MARISKGEARPEGEGGTAGLASSAGAANGPPEASEASALRAVLASPEFDVGPLLQAVIVDIGMGQITHTQCNRIHTAVSRFITQREAG
jgi:hypothetical protein